MVLVHPSRKKRQVNQAAFQETAARPGNGNRLSSSGPLVKLPARALTESVKFPLGLVRVETRDGEASVGGR